MLGNCFHEITHFYNMETVMKEIFSKTTGLPLHGDSVAITFPGNYHPRITRSHTFDNANKAKGHMRTALGTGQHTTLVYNRSWRLNRYRVHVLLQVNFLRRCKFMQKQALFTCFNRCYFAYLRVFIYVCWMNTQNDIHPGFTPPGFV